MNFFLRQIYRREPENNTRKSQEFIKWTIGHLANNNKLSEHHNDNENSDNDFVKQTTHFKSLPMVLKISLIFSSEKSRTVEAPGQESHPQMPPVTSLAVTISLLWTILMATLPQLSMALTCYECSTDTLATGCGANFDKNAAGMIKCVGNYCSSVTYYKNGQVSDVYRQCVAELNPKGCIKSNTGDSTYDLQCVCETDYCNHSSQFTCSLVFLLSMLALTMSALRLM
ncbi:hypothetical protein HELRODRAFT_192909 [Helobdella robusta]|uniref:Protein quiver n=1 Tax=Helobdella robusta TaxID=6412 RepID=T1FUF1_HELRO|nr:hypothetical protein HELRODRAFT_192909 [Helobdella robusta]ESN98410.1 hypothetical protein HELRODRAFT_192909 [Helobdella robusta]